MRGDDWLPLSEALLLLRPLGAGLYEDRARLARWLADGRVRMRAAEIVAFAPPEREQENCEEVAERDSRGVANLSPAPLPSNGYLERSAETDFVLPLELISKIDEIGALQITDDWWDSGELELIAGQLAPGARMTLYGLGVHREELAKAIELAGTAAPQDDAISDTSGASKIPRRGRPAEYDKPSFVQCAVDKLEYHGGFFGGDFSRDDLVAEMEEWCQQQRWPRVPGRTWLLEAIAEAEAKHLSAKSGK